VIRSNAGIPLHLGLLGGTFDPPHNGHLLLAETAYHQLGLDRVLFLPVGQPPHKPGQPLSAPHHRLAMVAQAIAPFPYFVLDASDMFRQPPHTTFSLLPLLQQEYPSARFWLLIGGDSLRDFASWDQPAAILALCRLAVLPRPGAVADMPALSTTIPNLATAIDWLDAEPLMLSSTWLRRQFTDNSPVWGKMPANVQHYVNQHQLYPPPQLPL